jgi:(p)ppGpp synthase/HD superfamily hydrolase
VGVTEEMKIGAALALAKHVHYGQTDKAGTDYFLHVRHVGDTAGHEALRYGFPELATDARHVGYLHDTIEDAAAGHPESVVADAREAVRDVIRWFFGDDILANVEAMTHRDGESYDAYVTRLSMHRVAPFAKLADLKHNSDVTRLGLPAGAEHPKAALYGPAVVRLDHALTTRASIARG